MTLIVRVNLLTVLTALTVYGQIRRAPAASNTPDSQGVIENFNFKAVDDLLRLDTIAPRMIIFREKGAAELSSVHLIAFKKWIDAGGIAYFGASGCQSVLLHRLELVGVRDYSAIKESGEHISDTVGELFLRGSVPAIRIEDHAITRGVQRLYVAGYYDVNKPEGSGAVAGRDFGFSGFAPLRKTVALKPILRLGVDVEYSVIRINKGKVNEATGKGLVTIFGIVEEEKGLMVFDGTGLIVGQGFKDSDGASHLYDWNTLFTNILNYRKD